MVQHWIQKSSILLLFFLPLLVGCGGGGKQNVPEWVNPLADAREALANGDNTKAKEALSASIEIEPNIWALMERAKIHLAEGDIEAAKSDCTKALELDPKSKDVKWLQGEIEKPKDKRFKGRTEFPPSYSK